MIYSTVVNRVQKMLICRKLFSICRENCVARKMRFHNWCFLKPNLKLPQVFMVGKVMTLSFEPLSSPTMKYSTFSKDAVLSAENPAEVSSSEHQTDLSETSCVSNFSELAVDIDTEKKIQLILMEYEISKQSELRVPSMLTLDNMKELLTYDTPSKRSSYMSYLFKKEKIKQSEQRKKEARRKEREIFLKNRDNNKQPDDTLNYGLGKNSIFFYIRDSTISRFYNHRQANAVLYGAKIVVDLDYDQFMSKFECENCAYQIAELHGANKRNKDPFDLYLCNAKSSSLTVENLYKKIPNMHEPNCFINLTNSSYLDIFPKNKLVYLSPHAKDVLQSHDHDTVYIIGGIVDKSCQDQVSLAKIKREGLKAVRLPLDEYLLWGLGSKSLPLNQIMQIMLELKNTGDWEKALRFVPRRKLKKLDEVSGEKFVRNRLKREMKPNERLLTRYSLFKE